MPRRARIRVHQPQRACGEARHSQHRDVVTRVGREYPDVLANTTSAFGINDWEWILAFEADDLSRIVDCIRRLRDAKARAYTKAEEPFVTGIRKEFGAAVRDLT